MADTLSDIMALLRRRIGLNPDSLRGSAIADAVAARMVVVGARQPTEYLSRLCRDEDEMAELIEQIVIPETWFFRDVMPFVCVREFVKQLPAGQAVRVLSVPCSTGEEAYSLAMTLLDSSMSPAFHVDGVDVSRRHLKCAEQAVYPMTSFREAAADFADFRERFFRKNNKDYVMDDSVRNSVTFRQGNLADTHFRPPSAGYHVVFCRHLLIYLDADARRTALANLRRAMALGGLLYVGHVEAAIAREGGFQTYRPEYPAAFVAENGPLPRAAVPSSKPRVSKPQPKLPRPVPDRPRPQPEAPLATHTPPTLIAARRAADEGRLDKALTLCIELLQIQSSADVYCLLAVVRQARGEVDAAEQCWQKALYLDPRHRESLVHLGLLARRRGDERQAELFRKRADRAAAEETAT